MKQVPVIFDGGKKSTIRLGDMSSNYSKKTQKYKSKKLEVERQRLGQKYAREAVLEEVEEKGDVSFRNPPSE